jgi:hypothetical protein
MSTLRVITKEEVDAKNELLALKQSHPDHDRHRAVMAAAEGGTGGDGTTGANGQDGMVSALVKYIPIPVMTVYTLLDGTFRSMPMPPTTFWFGCFFLLCIFAYVITYTMSDAPEAKPARTLLAENEQNTDKTDKEKKLEETLKKWIASIDRQKSKQAAIALIAFVGYVAAIGGPFTYLSNIESVFVWQGFYGTALLGFVTLVIYTALPHSSTT